MTAQTLPMQMGVDVVTVKDSFRANLQSASAFSFGLDHATAGGAMAATDVYSWKEVAKIWKSGKPVYRDTATGDFSTRLESGWRVVKQPRIGLYMSYQASMDEG